jgi:hypothetical protein
MAMIQKLVSNFRERLNGMAKIRWFIIIITLVFILGFASATQVLAVGPYLPFADTYTNLNDEEPTNYGNEAFMQLSASNAAGCVPATYLWFKFNVPNPAVTIDYAELAVPFEDKGGADSLDMQLLASPVTNWVEKDPNGITWATQPDLQGAPVLATAASAPPGADALFISSALASYLDGKKGQVVSLVVRANCAGSVGTSANRVIRTREHASGSGVELTMRNGGPSNIRLLSFASRNPQPAPVFWFGLLIFGLALGWVKIQRS